MGDQKNGATQSFRSRLKVMRVARGAEQGRQSGPGCDEGSVMAEERDWECMDKWLAIFHTSSRRARTFAPCGKSLLLSVESHRLDVCFWSFSGYPVRLGSSVALVSEESSSRHTRESMLPMIRQDIHDLLRLFQRFVDVVVQLCHGLEQH